MAASRRKYTAKQRAELVALAAVEGVTEAGRISEVPKTTIQYWTQQPEFAQLRTAARETVEEAFNIAIQAGLKALMANWSDATLKDQAYALGVIYDRHALMTGGATGRNETRDLTGTLSDGDVRDLLREAISLTTPAGASAEAAAPPED